MTRVPTVRKADLDRVFKALADSGQVAASVVVRPGGEVVITPVPAPPAGKTLTPSSPAAKPDAAEATDLDAFREHRRGRREAQGA